MAIGDENEDGGLYDHDIDDRDLDGSSDDDKDEQNSGNSLGKGVANLYAPSDS